VKERDELSGGVELFEFEVGPDEMSTTRVHFLRVYVASGSTSRESVLKTKRKQTAPLKKFFESNYFKNIHNYNRNGDDLN
jgi:hypothetical protein